MRPHETILTVMGEKSLLKVRLAAEAEF